METLYALLFGLIATAVMTILLYGVGQSGVGSVASVKAIGSAIPTPSGGSLVPGALVYIAAGLLFGVDYLALGRYFAYNFEYLEIQALLGLGALVGIARGLAVSIVLGLIAFNQDPLARAVESGFWVGLWHVVGSVAYGLTLSILFGVSTSVFNISVDFAVSF